MIHKQYDDFTVEYDVCLIRTDFEFDYDEYVKPVCIWPYPIHDKEDVYLGGWGNLAEDGNTPDNLQVMTHDDL